MGHVHHDARNKCKREGTHFVEVEPAGTTKECASCGVESGKPLWVREHSCPACGFEMDRDGNTAINILSRGFENLGLGQSEESTPVETALPMFTSSGSSDVVDVKRVVETGSPITRSQRLLVSSHTVGYRHVTDFDTPGCRKSSRSYSQQYQNSESSDDTLKERTASAVSE